MRYTRIEQYYIALQYYIQKIYHLFMRQTFYDACPSVRHNSLVIIGSSFSVLRLLAAALLLTVFWLR